VRIDVVRLPHWAGIPHARNAGAAAARGEYLFVTDANVSFPADWDLPIRERARPDRALSTTIADPGSGFRGFGCTLILHSMTACWLASPFDDGLVPIAPCTGSVIPAELFRRLGGYDTAMPMYGAAEPELSVRMWLSGAEIVCLPDLVLNHRFRPKPERENFLKAIRRTQVQNFLRFGLLYLDEVRMNGVYRHYADRFPDIFEECLKSVWQSDVAVRRETLRKSLTRDFGYLVDLFGLGEGAMRAKALP
jgi:glycosyltransferase involved in cell wall biosynthesis